MRGFSIFRGKLALQGIILGYGKENSETFERAMRLRSEAMKFSKVEAKTPEEFKEQISLYVKEKAPEEILFLKKLENFSNHQDQEKFPLKIGFSYYKDSEESKKLLISYSKAEKKISSLLNRDDFLKQILEKLTQ